MSQLIITGAVIAGWYTRVKEGQKEIEIDIQANWTNDLGVPTPADGYGKSDLVMKLNGVNFILTPHDPALKTFEIDITCALINKFKYVPRLDKEGDIRSREVHFKVHSGMQEGAARLENYVGHVGDHVGEMKIIYNDQADQAVLQMDGEVEEPKESEGEETTEEPEKQRGRRKAEATEPAETIQ